MELVKLYYDEETALRTIEEFDTIFIKKEIPDDIPEIEMGLSSMKLVDLLKIVWTCRH